MRNLFLFVGLRHLKEKPLRTVLTALGVALGVALYIAILIINKSTINSFKENINAMAGKATLTVSGGETGFPEEKLEIVQKFPGVKHAVPMVESHGFFRDGTQTESLVFLGVDMLKEQSVRTYKTTDEEGIDDPLTFLNQPDSVIMSNSFATIHHLKIDSKFEVATTNGRKTLTVRGLLTPQGAAKAYGGDLCIMDIDGARMTFGKTGKLDRIDIVTQEGIPIDALAIDLEKALGPGYHVDRPEGQQESMERLVRSYQMMLSFFSTLALLVGLFLVANSMNISVAERRREIGTLRAVGGTKSSILILFICESVIVGFLGAILGVILGRLLASYLVDLVTRSLSNQYLMTVKTSHLIFGWREIFVGLLIGTGASAVASIWPAWRATTVGPLEAMKRVELTPANQTGQIFSKVFYFGLFSMVYFSLSSFLKWGERYEIFEHLNSIACLVGPALMAPPLVSICVRFLRPFNRFFNSTVSRLAQDGILKNSNRMASNVMTLVIGLMLVVLLSASNASFKNSIVGWFDRVFRADILVSSFGRVISFQVQPLAEELGRDIEKVPGVLMGPKRGAYGIRFIHFRYEGKQLGLKAYDEPNPAENNFVFDLQDRPAAEATFELFHSKDLTAFVSENFVLHFGKKTGEIIEIDTPTGRQRIRIAGVIIDFASPEGVLYMDREKYKTIWKDSLVDGFGLKAAKGVDPADLRKAIDYKFGAARGLMTVSNREMKLQIEKSIDDSFAYTKAIEVAALLVAALGLLNTFLISIMERTRELGMLRAIGMSRGQLFSLLVQEALFQGTFGSLLAVLMGAYVSWLWINNSLSHVLGWIVRFHFPIQTVLLTLFLGMGVAFLSALYPAWKAAHLEIREALEYE